MMCESNNFKQSIISLPQYEFLVCDLRKQVLLEEQVTSETIAFLWSNKPLNIDLILEV